MKQVLPSAVQAGKRKTVCRRRKLGGPAVAAALILALMGGGVGCKPTEEKAKKAEAELIASLLLPPDTAPNPKSQVNLEKDWIMLTFGTKDSVAAVSGFFKEEIPKKGYEIKADSDNGISFVDDKKRQISITWFARDPDLSEFSTVFNVMVNPLPKAIRNYEESKLKAK